MDQVAGYHCVPEALLQLKAVMLLLLQGRAAMVAAFAFGVELGWRVKVGTST